MNKGIQTPRVPHHVYPCFENATWWKCKLWRQQYSWGRLWQTLTFGFAVAIDHDVKWRHILNSSCRVHFFRDRRCTTSISSGVGNHRGNTWCFQQFCAAHCKKCCSHSWGYLKCVGSNPHLRWSKRFATRQEREALCLHTLPAPPNNMYNPRHACRTSMGSAVTHLILGPRSWVAASGYECIHHHHYF